MALLPARRNSTLSRPGSQAPARWDLIAESGDLYQRMGQLMSGASGGGWQPPVQGWAQLPTPSETVAATHSAAGRPTRMVPARYSVRAGRPVSKERWQQLGRQPG